MMRRPTMLASGAASGLLLALVAALRTEAFLLPLQQQPATVGRRCLAAPAATASLAAARAATAPWSRLAAAYDEEAASSVLGQAGMEPGPEGAGDMDRDGVSLQRLQDPQSDAAYLEEQVTKWLDQEWIPQECHRDVAKVAASTYVKARAEGMEDLTSMLLEVGTTLETADMGDAFVDAWTVANKVSDLLLARMGREVCCTPPEFSADQKVLMTEGRSASPTSTVDGMEEDTTAGVDALTLLEAPAPAAPSQRADTPPLLNPQMPPAFFTMEALHAAAEGYLDEFARFDFVRKFLDGGHEGIWEQANLVMAILLGFRFDEWGNVDASGLHPRFRHLPFPPDFQGSAELTALLEAILAEDEDEDKQKGLEEFLEVMVGKAYYHQPHPADPDFAARATLVKWVYEHDFVNDFANLPSVQAILDVKARIQAKREGDKPPPRYLY